MEPRVRFTAPLFGASIAFAFDRFLVIEYEGLVDNCDCFDDVPVGGFDVDD